MNFHVLTVETIRVTLAWNELPCPFQNGPISGYVIEYTPDGGTPSITSLIGNSQLTGLTACTKYTLRIAATNDVGISDFSPSLSFVTSEIGKV